MFIQQNNRRLLFYVAWIVLGLIQASFTELQDDEAYYWVYGKYLDWGYFDHPPMIGLLTKMGYWLFENELGVRLFPLLFNTLSILLIEKILDKKDPTLFYTIILSIAVLQVTGFMAVPDTPLIFFTALFFFIYKKFLGNRSIINTLLLGFSIALLFYSKYHAVLIVLFTVLSNIRLLAKYQAWLAGFIALLLYTPHLVWQYEHDWVSFRYHLFESNVNDYRISFTLDYLAGQLLLAGPLAGIILIPAAFLYKPTSPFEKALKFTMVGIYAFFLLSSFRGKVEANWTSPVMIPLVILSHNFLSGKLRLRKILFRLLPLTILLVLIARVALMVDFLPLAAIKERYHAWKRWPSEVREITRGLPVVFSNSYQRASKYWFYTGQMTLSQNHYRERRNNYNYWPIEDSMIGHPVYFLDKYDLWRFTDSVETTIGHIGYKYDSLFASFSKIKILTGSRLLKIPADSTLKINFSFEVPTTYATFIKSRNNLDDTTRIGIFNDSGWIKDVITPARLKNMINEKSTSITFDPKLPPGKYYLRFAINNGYYNPTHNSEKIALIVE